jgi:hypothetical protein
VTPLRIVDSKGNEQRLGRIDGAADRPNFLVLPTDERRLGDRTIEKRLKFSGTIRIGIRADELVGRGRGVNGKVDVDDSTRLHVEFAHQSRSCRRD